MKKILSVSLVAALLIGLIPSVFAAENARNVNEWVFTSASHGKSNILAYDLTNKVSAFTMDETVASVSDKWEFVNQVGGSGYNIQSNCFHFYGNSSAIPGFGARSFVLEIQTDLNGTVSPSITVSKNTYGVIWEIYLIEKPSNPEAWHCNTPVEGRDYGNLGNISALTTSIDTKYRLGVIDAYSAETKVVTDVFPEITVKPGSYYLVGVANGANPGWAKTHQMIDLMSFKMKNRAVPDVARYNYNISSDALASTAISDYGNNHIKNDAIDNGELLYISWELLDPTKHVALDLTKTDGYRLHARQAALNTTLALHDVGVYQEFRLVSDADKEEKIYSYNSESIADRMHYMIKLNVPAAGKYSLSILNKFSRSSFDYKSDGSNPDYRVGNLNYMPHGAATTVYIMDAKEVGAIKHTGWYYNANRESAAQFDSRLTDANRLGIYKSSILATDKDTPAVTTFDKTIDLAAGEYYVLFDLDKNSYAQQTGYWSRTTWYSQYFVISGIRLTPIDETDYDSVNNTYDEIVNVDAGNGKEIATTIENAEVKAVAADINGNAISNSAIIPSEEVAVGSGYTADAPEIEGYKFLYWAKGIGKNRKIVSHNESYSFKVTSGGTLLMAVYAKNDSAADVAMFYNGNGQLLATQTGSYNAPSLPTMAGFGKATHWALAGSDEEFAAGASGEISGEMSFVAQYGDIENVTVTVENGAGGGEVSYGSSVTVTATERKGGNGTGLFNYWENENGEILSFDSSYTFKALKDTTVRAVYKEYKPTATAIRKIVVTRDGKNVFAEFIGIGNVIERGILFGENASLASYTAKVTMNTDGDEFTAYNDLEDEPKAIGYAILAGGKVIYSK